MNVHKFVLITCCALVTVMPAAAQTQDPVEMAEYQNGLLPASTYSGLAGKGSVNLYNGGIILGVPLFTLPGRAGHDLNLTLTYNSKQISRYEYWSGGVEYRVADFFYKGPTFGRWTLNVWPSLQQSGNAYYFATPDGSVHKLVWNSSAGGYLSNDGTNIRYASNGVHFLDGTYFDFSEFSSNLKVHHVDRNGNRITYEFETTTSGQARPYRVIDTLGRIVELVYASASTAEQLTQIKVKNHAGNDLVYQLGYTVDYRCSW